MHTRVKREQSMIQRAAARTGRNVEDNRLCEVRSEMLNEGGMRRQCARTAVVCLVDCCWQRVEGQRE